MAVVPPTALNDKLQSYIAQTHPATPCLVLDVDRVAHNYHALHEALPLAQIFYAIKANPAAPILKQLAILGASFDCASVNEIDMALAAGCPPPRISYGNTIKKQKDIAAAYARGIRIFAFDSEMELAKLAQAAPGSHVFCRILTSGEGAEWPLSRKFGCEPDMAYHLLLKAMELGLQPWGVSFHVGSQQLDPRQWDIAVGTAAGLFRLLAEQGVQLDMINLGGGFPCTYQKEVPSPADYAHVISQSLTDHFGTQLPGTIIMEPGRGIVGDAGVVLAEVVLVSRKHENDTIRWVYLDIGLYGGMQETLFEGIHYQIETSKDADPQRSRVIIAGPTCDSTDVLYEKADYKLPDSLAAGDRLTFHCAGAYTTTYASQSFNGFKPLDEHYI